MPIRARARTLLLPAPFSSYLLGCLDIIHHEHELIVMITVLSLDDHPRICHAPDKLAELPGFFLVEAVNDNVSHRRDADSRVLECFPRRVSIVKKKMRDRAAVDDPRPATFDAHTSVTKRMPHPRELAGTVFKLDLEIFHAPSSCVRGVAAL